MNPVTVHDLTTRILHALLAISMLSLFPLGLWMVELNFFHPWYHRALELHKAGGMLALGVIVLKLAWRWRRLPLPLATPMAAWQRRVAELVHFLLLSFALLVPVTGYLISTSAGEGVSMFGLFEVPAVISKSEDLRDWATLGHAWMAYALAGIAVLHIAAALQHGFLKRDGTLKRMFW